MIFEDRISQYPNRRRFTVKEQNVNLDGETELLVDIEREEGTVTNEGTPLNAETLNQIQGIPIYNATFDETHNNIKNYRISDVEWNDIPVGSIFAVIFNTSTQGTTNDIIGLRFATDNSSRYIFYSMPDYPITFENTQYVRVGSRKYLLANRPYVMEKLAQNNLSTPMIALMDHFDTAKFGATLALNGNTIQLKNLDGNSISNVSLPASNQTTLGGVKMWMSGTTLNISTT